MTFESPNQMRDYMKLSLAIDQADTDVPCTNFPDAYFIEELSQIAEQNLAKAACKVCPVREECLEYALKWEQYGLWGGLTPGQRRKIRFTIA
jgi:WhiB family transcriptional regulator, redox-sensing transcriptional regulator